MTHEWLLFDAAAAGAGLGSRSWCFTACFAAGASFATQMSSSACSPCGQTGGQTRLSKPRTVLCFRRGASANSLSVRFMNLCHAATVSSSNSPVTFPASIQPASVRTAARASIPADRLPARPAGEPAGAGAAGGGAAGTPPRSPLPYDQGAADEVRRLRRRRSRLANCRINCRNCSGSLLVLHQVPGGAHRDKRGNTGFGGWT